MQESNNILIDHLDLTLQGKALPEAEQMIRSDANAREEWQYLQLAVEAIQYHALYEQVAVVKEQYLAEKQVKQLPAARNNVVRMMRNTFRVAAAVLLLAGAFVVYKYYSTSSAGFYNDQYASFELPVSRGEAETGKLELAYRKKDWNGVIAFFEMIPGKNNRHLFLAGMAMMELKKYHEATGMFAQVIANNDRTGDDYFGDEAEYYLAMGFLAGNRTGQAMAILKKIKANPDHLFYKKVAAMPVIEVKILDYKSGK